MGTLYSIFVTSIIGIIISEWLVLFGDKEHRPFGFIGLVICSIGFILSFFSLIRI